MEVLDDNHQSVHLFLFFDPGLLIGLLVEALPLIELFEDVVETSNHLCGEVDKLHVEHLIHGMNIPGVHLEQIVGSFEHLHQLVVVDGRGLEALIIHPLAKGYNESLYLSPHLHYSYIRPIYLRLLIRILLRLGFLPG